MAGFIRGTQSPKVIVIPDAVIHDLVSHIMAGAEAEFVSRAADPFLCDDPCPHNAGAPHQVHPSCGELVCVLCTKVF